MSANLLHILNSIWSHPFNEGKRINAFIRFFKWQFFSRFIKWDVIYPVTSNTRMLARRGMTGITGCIYSGLLEFEEMFFVLHSLNTDDVFVDIGANVGIFTILAAGEKGANVISIEPIKNTYDILQENVKLNKLESKIQTLNIGISDSKGILNFVSEHGTINHVVSDLEKKDSKTESVFVDSLDNICEKKIPLILKIDVEGFETNVINGAKKIIENNILKAIIIELNGLGKRYGFDEMKIHDYLINQGFNCYNYDPYKRKFNESNFDGIHNTIYIRDLNFFKNRVKNSPQISLIGQLI